MDADECRCERCQAPLAVGDWPYCPHGSGRPAVIADDIPGGQWFENGFETPRKFYSHSEHRRALAEEGCEIVAKYAGPLDKHLTNWAAMIDPYTLEAARALVSRPSRASRSDDDEEWPTVEGDTPQITGRAIPWERS